MTRGWALFWGLVLVLVGALALLFNLGLLQPEQLSRLGALWPLLLILVGLQIVLARTLPRNAAVVAVSVLAFVLVAGSVGYVVSAPAVSESNRSVGVSGLGTGPATLRVALAAGRIDLTYAAGAQTRASLDYKGGSPHLGWDAGTRTLTVSHSQDGAGFLSAGAPDRLTVTLDSAVTWTVEIDAAASSTTIHLATPSGHERISLNGGATQLTVLRPSGAALGVGVNGGANSISVDGRSVVSGIGSASWHSSGFPAADDFEITVNGGANRVTITTSG